MGTTENDQSTNGSQQEVDELSDETPEEARLNRGIVTVFEQTKESETFEAGERYLSLGYDGKAFMLDEDAEDFVVQAVPIAHIELPRPMTRDEYSEWLESDAGKLAVSHFFDGMEHGDVLTEWGEERSLLEGSA